MLKLTHENYHSPEANKFYMSVSGFKELDTAHGGCEARAVAKLKGEWEDDEKKAFLVGSYVHSWNESPEAFKKFCKENEKSIYKKNGGMYADFEQADRMIYKLKNDELVTKVREGEKEVIMTAQLFGVWWKIMIDIYNPAMKSFTDLITEQEPNKASLSFTIIFYRWRFMRRLNGLSGNRKNTFLRTLYQLAKRTHRTLQ